MGKAMKPGWLGVAALALVILAFSAFASEVGLDEAFLDDRASRIKRIDYELRQVAAEQARLESEKIGLAKERACTLKAKDPKAMRACSLLR
jgi:hypothetical protein